MDPATRDLAVNRKRFQSWWKTQPNAESREASAVGLDNHKYSVISKAAAISGIIRDVTIGPNSPEKNSEDDNYIRDTTVPAINGEVAGHDSEEVPSSTVDRTYVKESMTKSPDGDTDCSSLAARVLKKQLLELEQHRKMCVRESLLARLQDIEKADEHRRNEMSTLQKLLQQETEAKARWQEQSLRQQLQEEAERASERQERRAQEHKEHAQMLSQRNQMMREAEERQKEMAEETKRKLQEKKNQLDKIHQFQVDYRNKYQQILDVAKTCKDRQALAATIATHATKWKALNEAMDQLVKQCKVGEVSALDLQTGAAIVLQIESILAAITEEVEAINQKHNKAAADAGAARQKEMQEAAAAATATKEATETLSAKILATPTTLPEGFTEVNEFGDKQAIETYIAFQQRLNAFERSFHTLLSDDSLKKFRFECQKAVNVPVNAISPVSGSHLQDKLMKLSRLISGHPTEVGHGQVTAAAHPEGVGFCKNLLAQKLVLQGELTVSSKPEAAFAIAAIVVALWVDFPDVGELILAHFHRECPYLVPMFPPQVEGQSNQDYYRSLGYHYSESGEVEKQDKFLKRMSGIMQLYAAILVTPLRRAQQHQPHPHGLKEAWRWLACLVNMEPRPDICATLLLTFLEVTGSALSAHYGLQFQKLLHLICKEYFPRIEKMASSSSEGPVVRLEAFLQKVLKQGGRIPPPVGTLPLNFW